MRLSLGGKTDPGPREGHNQDSIRVVTLPGREDTALGIVADGMGGHKSGELASAEATRVIYEYIVGAGLLDPEEAEACLLEAILAANRAIHHVGNASPETEGMGCTVVVALVIGESYWIASVGDSRAYLVREGTLRQLTQDHTWVHARIQEGLLTPDEATSHMLRHVLDRALGPEPEVEVDVWPASQFQEGDVLVLCSDGLYNVLEEHIIVQEVAGQDGQQAAEQLIRCALEAPTNDNASVVVIGATSG